MLGSSRLQDANAADARPTDRIQSPSRGSRYMRVKLCARCPYTPRDLADHYDPAAALHACAKCDGEQRMLDQRDLGETHRRRKCSTTQFPSGKTQWNVAPFATESSASSVTIAVESPSVQSGASITSRPAGRATADGCGDFELHAAYPRSQPGRTEEVN
jgi:hypothetical protein